jgi:hypothetical protein
MTTAASAFPLIGSQAVGNFFVPDTIQRHPLGSVISFNDPFWGGGEAIYLQMPTSTALRVGQILSYDTATSFVAASVANTAGMGKSVAFLMNSVASNASAQFAWCQISGQCPVYSSASVAADTLFGIVAAGQAGAVANGKQLLNARVTKPATTTVVKANTQTQNGSAILKVSNTDGWFVGVSVSGTGITTSLITAIDPDNRTVTLASNSSATGSVSATGTYNDATTFFNVVTCDRPFAQGQIV